MFFLSFGITKTGKNNNTHQNTYSVAFYRTFETKIVSPQAATHHHQIKTDFKHLLELKNKSYLNFFGEMMHRESAVELGRYNNLAYEANDVAYIDAQRMERSPMKFSHYF